MTPDQRRVRARVEALISLMGQHDPEPLAVHPAAYRPPRIGPGTR
jgi:hypothetical protein